MKRLVALALGGMLAVGLTAAAWGEDVPWKAGEGDKPAAPAPAVGEAPATPPVKEATAAKDVKMENAVKAIEAKVAQAEKVMDLSKKESEKPAEKQNEKLVNGYKLSAARMYLGAALEAKAQAGRFKKDEDKQSILDQYEKPNKEKAIAIFLELAGVAKQKGDLRAAAGLYQEVLKIDPQNAEATAALKQMQEELKAAQKNGPNSKNKGGGNDNNGQNPPDPSMKKTWRQDPNPKTDWGHSGW
jgi:hypothetical protein